MEGPMFGVCEGGFTSLGLLSGAKTGGGKGGSVKEKDEFCSLAQPVMRIVTKSPIDNGMMSFIG